MTDEEIVHAIADELNPWKPQNRQIETGERAGEMEAKSHAEIKAEISDAVHSEITRFQNNCCSAFFQPLCHPKNPRGRAECHQID